MSRFEFYGWRVEASTNEDEELILRVTRMDGRNVLFGTASGTPGEDGFASFTPAAPEPERWFRNFYRHDDPRCMTSWEDVWQGTVNDRCPSCGAEIEPYRSEDARKEDAR